MKKILSIFAAMLVAVAVNAGEVSVNPGNDALIAALQSASADDVLILADGTYNEYSNYIDFNKNIEVKAAEGAKPVINVGCYIKVQGNATVKIQGIKFDGTEQGHNGSSYNHFMRVYSVNSLELEGCEFSNTKGNKVIEVEAANHLGVLKINNCYFHDGNYSAIHVAQGSDAHACDKIIITNSTFANFGGFNEGMIEIYSKNGALAASTDEDVEINVDHCTFYNISKTDEGSTYGVLDIRKSANAVVSNCIFANPATLAEGAYANRATQMYGGAITNCLLFNTPNHRTDAVTPANPLKDVDPLFVDAANGNFALGEGSPALGAGTDGSNLGDPRWNVEETPAEPQVLYLRPGEWYWEGNQEKFATYSWADGKAAIWSDYMTLAENETDIWTGTIPAGYTDVIFVRFSNASTTPSWEDNMWNQTVNLTIQEGKDMFSITGWGDYEGAPCTGVWSKYGVAPLADGFYLVGKFGGVDAWDYASLTAEKQFVWNTHIGEGNEEWKVVADLVAGDKVKACYVYQGAITEYFPGGEGNEYVVDENHAGAGKTIYFQQMYNSDWGGQFYIEPNAGSAIHNAAVEAKTVKMMENGQLVIIKNGVKYNVLGTAL